MKTIYEITKQTIKRCNYEFREYANGEVIFKSESLDEAKTYFNNIKGKNVIGGRYDCKNYIEYYEYTLDENEVDEDGDYIGCAETIASKLVEVGD